jgi:hypothetical protein
LIGLGSFNERRLLAHLMKKRIEGIFHHTPACRIRATRFS